MALSYWTRDQLQARVFANLMQQDSDDNDLLSATQVQDALYLGEMALARDARTHRRAGDITAVDEQAEYNLPEDMPVVVDVTWDDDTEPLRMTDEANLARFRRSKPRTGWPFSHASRGISTCLPGLRVRRI